MNVISLESVELAVERDGEHEDAEDDADGVEHAQLRDQPPERDLQTELGLIDYDQRQNVSWKNPCNAFLHQRFCYLPMIPTHPMDGRNNPSSSHL